MPFFVSLLGDLGQESIFSVNLGNALLHYLRTTNEYTFAFLALQCSNKYAYLFFSYQNCTDVFSYSVKIMCDSQPTAFKGHHVSVCWHVHLFACMHAHVPVFLHSFSIRHWGEQTDPCKYVHSAFFFHSFPTTSILPVFPLCAPVE